MALAQGTLTAEVATTTGYTADAIRTLTRRPKASGPAALGNRHHANPGGATLLTSAQ